MKYWLRFISVKWNNLYSLLLLSFKQWRERRVTNTSPIGSSIREDIEIVAIVKQWVHGWMERIEDWNMHVYLLPTWRDRFTFVGEELRRHWKRVIVGTLVYIKVVSSVMNTLSIIIGLVFDNNG